MFSPTPNKFQSTSPQGRRLHSGIFKSIYTDFNPRLRKGDDVYRLFFRIEPKDFNPRLRKGDDISSLNVSWEVFNFNPRLRKGDDKKHMGD